MAKAKSKPRTGRSPIAAVYLDDDLVLSRTHAWTCVQLPQESYEYRTSEARESVAQRIALAFAGLLKGEADTVNCHLILTSLPHDTGAWRAQLDAAMTSRGWKSKPGWQPYVDDMTEYLAEAGFRTQRVYLLVELGTRSHLSFDDLDVRKLAKKLWGAGDKILLADDPAVSDEELNKWRGKARAVRSALADSSYSGAVGTPARDVAWLIKKPLWGTTECPTVSDASATVWGKGAIDQLADSVVTNGHKYVGLTQIDPASVTERTSYSATLSVARFPETMSFPESEPWIYYAAGLDFPVDWSIRFELIPPSKAHKDVSKKAHMVRDEAAHILETGQALPLQVQENLEKATLLEYSIRKRQVPWVYARYRIRVSADTPEELVIRCRKVIDRYRDLGIDVAWPSGDQLDLLLEAMPGEKVRSSAYQQYQEVLVIAGGMPTASSEVGNMPYRGKGWIGPYVGETTARRRSPVFFGPHVLPTQDRDAGIAIVGKPGSGKSFLGFSLAHQCAAAGVHTIFIDPKRDAVNLGLLPGMGQAKVFDLMHGNDGMIDPFSLGDDVANSKLLALETVRLLLGGSALSEEREAALIAAIDAVAVSDVPSLSSVVDWLLAADDLSARNLGSVLRTLRELPFARLCFSPQRGVRLDPEDGLMVFTLLGLDYPEPGMGPDTYSYENRLAVAVLYLLTRFARRLFMNMDPTYPKAIFIDEAWTLAGTAQGATLIQSVARMGRSHSTALCIISQNARDMMDERVTNSISTVAGFFSDDETEIDAELGLLRIEKNDTHRADIRGLQQGECIMRDAYGRVSRVYIDAWNRDLFTVFNTNPDRYRDESGLANPFQANAAASREREDLRVGALTGEGMPPVQTPIPTVDATPDNALTVGSAPAAELCSTAPAGVVEPPAPADIPAVAGLQAAAFTSPAAVSGPLPSAPATLARPVAEPVAPVTVSDRETELEDVDFPLSPAGWGARR